MGLKEFMFGLVILTIPTLGPQIWKTIQVNRFFDRDSLRGLHAGI